MRADKEMLLSLANKLTEIWERTSDIETESELGEVIEMLVKTAFIMDKSS